MVMSLSTLIFRRIAISGLLALSAAVTWQIANNHGQVISKYQTTVDSMHRILSMQFVGLSQSAGLAPRFPDWDPIRQVERPLGSCAHLFDDKGALLRSACTGYLRPGNAAPEWFSRVYLKTLAFDQPVSRQIVGTRDEKASIELRPEPLAEADMVWAAATALTVPAALIISLLCVVVWWSVGDALKPVKSVMQSLGDLEQSITGTRIGPFPTREFSQIALACNRLATTLEENRIERLSLSRKLLSVQESERRAIACDLHDEFGQHLSAISASAAVIRPVVAGQRYVDDVLRIEQSAAKLHEHLRMLLHKLRPWNEGELNLSESIRDLVGERTRALVSPAQSIDVTVSVDGDFNQLSNTFCSAVYRIVQEAFTNALRHADATRIAIDVSRTREYVAVNVVDDGKGCDAEQLGRGFGIAGIRERCLAYGAEPRFTVGEPAGLVFTVEFVINESLLAS